MKITIICIGKIKEKFYRDAVLEYLKRLSRYSKTQIKEADDEPLSENASEAAKEAVLLKEGERINKLIPSGAFVIVLDSHGKKMDSEGFSKFMEDLGVRGQGNICFIIGGSVGINEGIKNKADIMISFSDMTFPHQLMRVILLEQIYRGFRIMKGEPYHK